MLEKGGTKMSFPALLISRPAPLEVSCGPFLPHIILPSPGQVEVGRLGGMAERK